jgi:hypothetical protein
MANAEAPKATMRLFNGCWLKSTPRAAILKSLSVLANGYEKPLTDGMVMLYTAALLDLSPPEIVLAFARATEECKFFPSPATLREYSGQSSSGDPIEREAKQELLYLIGGMRTKHGPTSNRSLDPSWSAPRMTPTAGLAGVIFILAAS